MRLHCPLQRVPLTSATLGFAALTNKTCQSRRGLRQRPWSSIHIATAVSWATVGPKWLRDVMADEAASDIYRACRLPHAFGSFNHEGQCMHLERHLFVKPTPPQRKRIVQCCLGDN